MAVHAAQPARPAGPQELPKGFVQEVLARSDIERVVGRYVPLRKQGANLLGLCPFHGEKSPSFTVAPQKQFFHCFGCGQNGDAITFLREFAGLTFREAVMELAQEAGLRLPEQATAAPAVDSAPMYRANEVAAAFFRHCLAYEEPVKDYLRSRQLPESALEHFVIGYAPDAWNGLAEAFPDYARNRALVDTGLVIQKDDGKRYDRFRDRLMFGIRDARGRVVGFGGRTMQDAQGPKYLNSSESAIFDKGSTLFGVYEARQGIRESKQALVVEGYMDCAALSMAGIPQTVATMGTACTATHIERLQTLAPETVFAFDGDAAGLKAAWRSLLTCLPFATDAHRFRFLLLPGGLDPDELVIQEGADAFRARISKALSLSEFLLEHLRTQHNNLATPEDRAAFAKEATELTYQMPAGGRLGQLVRQEIMDACGLAKPAAPAYRRSITQAASSNARPRPWAVLARAALTQRLTASQSAAQAVEALPAQLQDAFFAEQWQQFPTEQQPFWQALQQAIVADGRGHAVDEPGADADVAKDLLKGAYRVVAAETRRAERAERMKAFRSGQISESQMLDAALRQRSP